MFPFVLSLLLGTLLCSVTRSYVPPGGLLVVLSCFILRRIRFSAVSFSNVCDRGKYFLTEYVYAVGSHGGEGWPGIFCYTEYVYILCIVTGASFLNRTILYGMCIRRV